MMLPWFRKTGAGLYSSSTKEREKTNLIFLPKKPDEVFYGIAVSINLSKGMFAMAVLKALQLDYILRILIAGICGGIIGYERKNRMKEAGIRTHFIVAVGAALMMVVSKYGFFDLIGTHNISIDPTRIAAQIVSGIGFLGAGVIFVQSQTVIGLTTAAGLWTTAGIGMAIGAGMYSIGLFGTIIVVMAQMLLHKKFSWLSTPKIKQVSICLDGDGYYRKQDLLQKIKKLGIIILNYHEDRDAAGEDEVKIDITLELPKNYTSESLLEILTNENGVHSLEFL